MPEKAALFLPSLDLDVVVAAAASSKRSWGSSSTSSTTTLGEVLSRALDGGDRSSSNEGGRQRRTRGPPLRLLLGARASAEPALDSWAAAWARVAANDSCSSSSFSSSSSSSSSALPIVDLTLFERVSPILLALPGGKGALLRGAAEGARRRGGEAAAAVVAAAAHFGGGGRGIREALGATNALAGYCCVLDCERGGGGGGGENGVKLTARVRWIGAGEAEPAEEEGLREVVRSLLQREASRG